MRSGCVVDPLAVGDIILTHLHGDHCAGLETLGFLHRYKTPDGSPGPRPRLHAISAVLDRVWERLAPAMDGRGSTMETYFEPCELSLDGAVEIAGCRVECRQTRHSVPTAGLLIEAGGARLGWSSDSEFDMEHVEWLSSADCIVHECGEGPKHTTFAELASLPEELRRRIRILHRPDDAPPIQGDPRLLAEGEHIQLSGTAERDSG